MAICIATYPDYTQLGPTGVAANFVTQPGKPVVFAYEAETCASGELRLYSSVEVDSLTASIGSPFVLSVADGALISGLVVGVWAAAFAIRALIRAANPTHDGV